MLEGLSCPSKQREVENGSLFAVFVENKNGAHKHFEISPRLS